MAKTSQKPSNSKKHWAEPAANKREKKRLLSGQLDTSPARGASSEVNCSAEAIDGISSRLQIGSLVECFAGVADPRINRRRRHLLIDIMVISICAVICNADTWKDIAIWGETHRDWLSKFLELPNGIPTRDTFRRTISRIQPDAFQNAFIGWISGLKGNGGGIIAIDGKTLRASKVNGNKPLHIVSAWATAQHLTLGQTTIDEKSNEITAIPKLLKTLELKGAIVTIDAMGCQKDNAEKIIEGKGDYCLAVKGNQEKLYEDLSAMHRMLTSVYSNKRIHLVYQCMRCVSPMIAKCGIVSKSLLA